LHRLEINFLERFMNMSVTRVASLTQPNSKTGAEADQLLRDLIEDRRTMGDSSVTIETTLSQLEMMMNDQQERLTELMSDFESKKVSLSFFTTEMQKLLAAMGVTQDTIKRFLQMVANSARSQ
jgi:transaldolase